MIFLRQILKLAFLYLGNLVGFRRLPGGLYYSDIRFLERMVALYNNGDSNIVFVKPGFYLFNGDDVAIYSHTEGFAMKADVVSVKWKRTVDITSDEWNAMGEANLTDRYVTLFECNNLRGRLFNDVSETISFRNHLLAFSIE